jgi:hypothetical protein
MRPPVCPTVPPEVMQYLWAVFGLVCALVLNVIFRRRR